MSARTQTLSDHVDSALTRFRLAITLAGACVVSLIFGITIFLLQVKSDRVFLKGIGNHVAALLEIQDRAELQRFLHSIKDSKGSDFRVIQNRRIVATTVAVAELDTAASSTKPGLTRAGLVNVFIPQSRNNRDLGAHVIMISPLSPIVALSSILALLVFAIGALVGNQVSRQLRWAINRSLQNIQPLMSGIRQLKERKRDAIHRPVGIQEFDEIREAVVEAHDSLEFAQEELAQAKARVMLSDAYKRLIHDLKSPVQSLGGLVQLLDSSDAAAASEARTLLPQVAERILLQVDAARANLDIEAPKLDTKDIRASVVNATNLAKTALNSPNIDVEIRLPDSPVHAPYDETLLSRAIDNLVRNAIEAANVKVIVEVEKRRSDIRIRVNDDGRGMPMSDVGQYLQGRKTSTKANRQALGLSAVSHIVRSHGGRVVYSTSSMGGACFEIRMNA